MQFLKRFFCKSPVYEECVTFLLAFLYGAGLIFHLIPYTLEYVITMTDGFLLFSNLVVIFYVFRKYPSLKLGLWSLIALLVTYFIELAGVESGHIFGEYNYGDTMFLQIRNVPVVIAFNWVILIMATISISRIIIPVRWLITVFSTVLIVIFDYLMEPVAMKLDYWQWVNNTVPVRNYLAWAVITFIFSSLFVALRLSVDSRILRVYFFIQLLFFSVMRLALK